MTVGRCCAVLFGLLAFHGVIAAPSGESETPARVLRGDAERVSCLAWSPDGQRLASVGIRHNVVRLWEPESGRLLRVLGGHREEVLSAHWSQRGLLLAAATERYRQLRIWNTADPSRVHVLRGHTAAFLFVAWDGEGRRLATWDENGDILRIWDIEAGKAQAELHPLFSKEGIAEAAWSPDGKALAVASAFGDITVYSTTDYEGIRTVQEDPGVDFGRQSQLAWSPDGERLAGTAPPSTKQAIHVWSMLTGEDEGVLPEPEEHISKLSWRQDGRYLAYNGDRSVCVWDRMSGQIVRRLRTRDQTTVFAWRPDGKRLAIACWGGDVLIWRTDW